MQSQNLAVASKPLRAKINFWRWFWIATLVVSLPYCFYVSSNNMAWAADYTSAQQQAPQTGQTILFFTGRWCVHCRVMKSIAWADEQAIASVNKSFFPIDVDDSVSGAVRSRCKVGVTPRTIIADSNGNVLQKVGGLGKADFLEMLGKSSGMGL